MTPGLLLITHGRLGQEMLDTVTVIMHQCPLLAQAITVSCDCNPEAVYAQAARCCAELDRGGGILVLTDLYGSTPSNIASRLTESHHAAVVSGVNIPMLLRILNYPEMDLEQLCEKAASGACEGVVVTSRQQAS